MKTCRKCRIPKDTDDFYPSPTSRHKDGLRSWCKECESTHAAPRKDYFRAYYNRPEVRSKQRAGRLALSAQRAERNLFDRAKLRAVKKDLEFNLCLSDIVIPDMCPLLGIPIVRRIPSPVGSSSPSPNSPSLDRKNPTLGYTRDNVWVISNRANIIKSDATSAELLLIGERLAALGL